MWSVGSKANGEELKESFGDNNVINESLSKCTGTSKKELFVRLGPYENGSKIKPPKEQKLDDVPSTIIRCQKTTKCKKEITRKTRASFVHTQTRSRGQ